MKAFLLAIFQFIFNIFFIGRQVPELNLNPSPSPTEEIQQEVQIPEYTGFLSQPQRDLLDQYKLIIGEESVAEIDELISEYDLDENQKEVIWLFVTHPIGFSEVIDNQNIRYHNNFTGFSLIVPMNWKVFPSGYNHIGFLAPETDWNIDSPSGGQYGVDQVEYDFFVRADCSDRSYEDYVKEMSKDRKDHYYYPVTQGPFTEEIIGIEAQKYIMEIPVRPDPVIIEDYYFSSRGANYLVDFRYKKSMKDEYRPKLMSLFNSFSMGDIDCDYYSSKFSGQDFNDIVGEIRDKLGARK